MTSDIELIRENEGYVLRLLARCCVMTLPAFERKAEKMTLPPGARLAVDFSQLTQFDLAGAVFLRLLLRRWRVGEVQYRNIDRQQSLLLDLAQKGEASQDSAVRRKSIKEMARQTSRPKRHEENIFFEVLSYIGQIFLRFVHVWRRHDDIAYHFEYAGIGSLPVVATLSFLIGAVSAFMGSSLLENLNASILVISMVGIGVTRELGVLIAGILVAGRSGSAFTATLGSMNLGEEIDAVRVLKIPVLDLLVAPRLMAMLLSLPMLTLMAILSGLAGGLFVCVTLLDIPASLYMSQLSENIPLSYIGVALLKAPFFAIAITLISCFHGLRVRRSAEELGAAITVSVVQSLFAVVALDALFAMIFLKLDI